MQISLFIGISQKGFCSDNHIFWWISFSKYLCLPLRYRFFVKTLVLVNLKLWERITRYNEYEWYKIGFESDCDHNGSHCGHRSWFFSVLFHLEMSQLISRFCWERNWILIGGLDRILQTYTVTLAFSHRDCLLFKWIMNVAVNFVASFSCEVVRTSR